MSHYAQLGSRRRRSSSSDSSSCLCERPRARVTRSLWVVLLLRACIIKAFDLVWYLRHGHLLLILLLRRQYLLHGRLPCRCQRAEGRNLAMVVPSWTVYLAVSMCVGGCLCLSVCQILGGRDGDGS